MYTHIYIYIYARVAVPWTFFCDILLHKFVTKKRHQPPPAPSLNCKYCQFYFFSCMFCRVFLLSFLSHTSLHCTMHRRDFELSDGKTSVPPHGKELAEEIVNGQLATFVVAAAEFSAEVLENCEFSWLPLHSWPQNSVQKLLRIVSPVTFAIVAAEFNSQVLENCEFYNCWKLSSFIVSIPPFFFFFYLLL